MKKILSICIGVFFSSILFAQDPFPTLHSSGNWLDIRNGHELILMPDGKVLDWISATGEWRLWNYTPSNMSDCLSGSPANSGTWLGITTGQNGQSLVSMSDGKVLNVNYNDETWKLWNYDASNTGDCLPGSPYSSGSWQGWTSYKLFYKMIDGKVLRWDRTTGSWDLWNYTPSNTSDCLPVPSVSGGTWAFIGSGHNLTIMQDGKLLDWTPSTGAWKLWKYTPTNTSDCFSTLQASGTFTTIGSTKRLLKMNDGKVLDWEPSTGNWRLWTYNGNVVTANETPLSYENLQIYPNPTKDVINFETTLLERNSASLSLTDVMGKVISQESYDSFSGKLTKTFSLATLPTGVYFIKAQLGNQMITEKIVKE